MRKVNVNSLAPIPAKEIGSNPDRIVNVIIKAPPIEKRFTSIAFAKIMICSILTPQNTPEAI